MTVAITTTDETLLYNVGVFGGMGYAVPNFSDKPRTINADIYELVDTIGVHLFAIMHTRDVDSRDPPNVETLKRINQLVIGARRLIASRGVPDAKDMFNGGHQTPAMQDHIIHPVPFFMVTNVRLKSYCQLVLGCLSELMQDSANQRPYDFGLTTTGKRVGEWLDRIYRRVALELLLIPVADVAKDGFVITDAHLDAYDKSKVAPSLEATYATKPVSSIFTEDSLKLLERGIPASQLAGLCRWPSKEPVGEAVVSGNGAQPQTSDAAAAPVVPSFPK